MKLQTTRDRGDLKIGKRNDGSSSFENDKRLLNSNNETEKTVECAERIDCQGRTQQKSTHKDEGKMQTFSDKQKLRKLTLTKETSKACTFGRRNVI